MVLGGGGEAAHVLKELDRLLQTLDRLPGVDLLEAVGGVHVERSAVVFVVLLQVQVGGLDEGVARL